MSRARWRLLRIPCTKRRRGIWAGTYTSTRNNVAIVAGVDFGTLSVRVAIVDSTTGQLGAGVARHPVKRDRNDPDFATQSHEAQMNALVDAMHLALADAKVSGNDILALGLDTAFSIEIPVVEWLVQLDDNYLCDDHRQNDEAVLIK